MSLAVKEGYVNPLTMMGQKKNSLTLTQKIPTQRVSDQVQDLQRKQQTLQNNMLLLKSTTNGAAGTESTQKAIEQQLEEVKTQLSSAKMDQTSAATELTAKKSVESKGATPHQQNYDLYEKNSKTLPSPGLYQLQQDEEKGYRIKFSPFSE